MRIVIDYETTPDFSFCDEETWDCPGCGQHNESGAYCAGCQREHLVALCTLLYDDENDRVDRLVDSLGNSVFLYDADDWTTGSFNSVEDIPARCPHLRDIAQEMIAGYVPPLDPVQRGIALLDALHEEMAQGTGVHPFDIFDRIGTIVAVLKGEYNPDKEG